MTQPHWHISTYSGDRDNCVEVSVFDAALPGVVRVRDSKDRTIPEVQASTAAWQDLVRLVHGH
ncbi:DUF397 domain-containing protein [Streptomyces sp. LE64]|uniref:DUF397 domain-containing protein n=1 Tax=Streptomyces sp. LE64 TaxID=3448653 RepID=UPI0040416C08